MSELLSCPRKNGTVIINTCNRIPEEVWVDDEDFELVSKHKWYKYPSCRYVKAYINGKAVSIHRLVMGASTSQSIDHINGNSLDNRKCNLRFCSQAENMKNRKPNRNGRSPYKGVVVLKNGRFRAKIDSDGKRVGLGVYSCERDAVIAYNAAAKVLHGEFAYMNELPPSSATPALPRVTPEGLVEGKMYYAKQANGDPYLVGYVGGKPTGMEHYRGWFVRMGEAEECCHPTSTVYFGPIPEFELEVRSD